MDDQDEDITEDNVQAEKKSSNGPKIAVTVIVVLILGFLIGYLVKENQVNDSVTETVETNQAGRQDAIENQPEPEVPVVEEPEEETPPDDPVEE